MKKIILISCILSFASITTTSHAGINSDEAAVGLGLLFLGGILSDNHGNHTTSYSYSHHDNHRPYYNNHNYDVHVDYYRPNHYRPHYSRPYYYDSYETYRPSHSSHYYYDNNYRPYRRSGKRKGRK